MLARVSEAFETGRPAEVQADGVRTSGQVAGVLRAMLNDLRRHPDDWQNATLDPYLDALAEGLEQVDQAEPDWQLIADLLVSASGQE